MSDDPVKFSIALDQGQNRLWGIPILGLALRAIMVIPQAILLWFLAIGVWLMAFISWIPILLDGRMPGWGYALAGGYIRLSTRCSLYVILMTGKYPPFGITGEHPVTVAFDETERQNQLWGIPLVGLLVRWILLLPHFFVLWVLAIAIAFLSLVTWVPVIVNGRQADSMVRFYGGFYRWTTRVAAYALLLTGRYPSFSFDD